MKEQVWSSVINPFILALKHKFHKCNESDAVDYINLVNNESDKEPNDFDTNNGPLIPTLSPTKFNVTEFFLTNNVTNITNATDSRIYMKVEIRGWWLWIFIYYGYIDLGGTCWIDCDMCMEIQWDYVFLEPPKILNYTISYRDLDEEFRSDSPGYRNDLLEGMKSNLIEYLKCRKSRGVFDFEIHHYPTLSAEIQDNRVFIHCTDWCGFNGEKPLCEDLMTPKENDDCLQVELPNPNARAVPTLSYSQEFQLNRNDGVHRKFKYDIQVINELPVIRSAYGNTYVPQITLVEAHIEEGKLEELYEMYEEKTWNIDSFGKDLNRYCETDPYIKCNRDNFINDVTLDLRPNEGFEINTLIGDGLNLKEYLERLNITSDKVMEFPNKLKNLDKLKSLILSGKQKYIGSLPTQIGEFGMLRSLVLYDCGMEGSIPSELGLLSNLRKLDLGKNNFDNPIQENIFSLSKLRVLMLGNNQFTGTLSTGIEDLNKLLQLNLANNSLTGNLPSFTLGNLKVLDIQNNSFTGNFPDISGMPKLKIVALNDNNLEGEIPNDYFRDLDKLQFLNLQNNNFSGQLPESLADDCPNLKSLLVGGNPNLIISNELKTKLRAKLASGFYEVDILNG